MANAEMAGNAEVKTSDHGSNQGFRHIGNQVVFLKLWAWTHLVGHDLRKRGWGVTESWEQLSGYSCYNLFVSFNGLNFQVRVF